jgi:hypothetical protein
MWIYWATNDFNFIILKKIENTDYNKPGNWRRDIRKTLNTEICYSNNYCWCCLLLLSNNVEERNLLDSCSHFEETWRYAHWNTRNGKRLSNCKEIEKCGFAYYAYHIPRQFNAGFSTDQHLRQTKSYVTLNQLRGVLYCRTSGFIMDWFAARTGHYVLKTCIKCQGCVYVFRRCILKAGFPKAPS